MATRLEDYRDHKSRMTVDSRVELKDGQEVFKPNLFIEIVDEGIRIWGENGESITLPDKAIPALKKRLAWMTATA